MIRLEDKNKVKYFKKLISFLDMMRDGAMVVSSLSESENLGSSPSPAARNRDLNNMSWKTLVSKEVYKNRFMTVTEDVVETDSGKKLTYGVVHKKPFALIIPWNGEKFTLVGQYRYGIKKHSWEFPQGHFEHSSIEETAKTELKEETGISAQSIVLIGHFYLGPGHHSQECKVFLAEGLTFGNTRLETGEKESKLKTIQVTKKEFVEMIKNGNMEDGPSLAAWSILSEKL